METLKRKRSGDKTSEFKSYYVVWKPKYAIVKKTMSKSFKSYYVVWKPLSVILIT